MKLNYRPELDGLRMVAMIFVLLFHMELVFPFLKAPADVFSGGFLAVDVFFVISGYLISHLILRRLVAGDFSFSYFYERRIRRIVPALLLVVFINIPIALLLLDPQALKSFGTSLLGIGGFVSNYTFFKQANYFEPDAYQIPFLNTWSLGVEEQFYILFPLLLVVGWRFLKWRVVWLFAGLFVASFVCAHYSSGRWPEASFYLLHTRIWEIMAGVLLTFAEYHYAYTGRTRPEKPMLATIGLGLILLNMVLLTAADKHPSAYTLGAIVGTAMVIWYGSAKGVCGAFLTARASTLVGRMSYSMYLWHVPLLAFWSLSGFSQTTWHGPVIIAVLTFGLAYLSLILMEDNCRNAKRVSYKALLKVVVPLWLLMVGLGAWFQLSNGLPQRFKYPAPLEASFRMGPFIQNATFCLNQKLEKGAPVPFCGVGNVGKQQIDFALVGDSHAFSSMPAFDAAATQYGLRGVMQARSGCPHILGISAHRRGGLVHACEQLNNAVFDYVKTHNIKTIFMVGFWPAYTLGRAKIAQNSPYIFPEKEKQRQNVIEQNLRNTLMQYNALGVKVYVLGAVPKLRVPPRQIYAGLYMPLATQRTPTEMENYLLRFAATRQWHTHTNAWFVNLFGQLKADGLIADYISTVDAFCTGEKCPVGTPEQSYYFDRDHLSKVGALKLAPLLQGPMQNIK